MCSSAIAHCTHCTLRKLHNCTLHNLCPGLHHTFCAHTLMHLAELCQRKVPLQPQSRVPFVHTLVHPGAGRRYAFRQQPQVCYWNLLQLAAAFVRAEILEQVGLPWSTLTLHLSTPVQKASGQEGIGTSCLSSWTLRRDLGHRLLCG
jgi:hypothetical protein